MIPNHTTTPSYPNTTLLRLPHDPLTWYDLGLNKLIERRAECFVGIIVLARYAEDVIIDKLDSGAVALICYLCRIQDHDTHRQEEQPPPITVIRYLRFQ